MTCCRTISTATASTPSRATNGQRLRRRRWRHRWRRVSGQLLGHGLRRFTARPSGPLRRLPQSQVLFWANNTSGTVTLGDPPVASGDERLHPDRPAPIAVHRATNCSRTSGLSGMADLGQQQHGDVECAVQHGLCCCSCFHHQSLLWADATTEPSTRMAPSSSCGAGFLQSLIALARILVRLGHLGIYDRQQNDALCWTTA